jgi:hypothetical protein
MNKSMQKSKKSATPKLETIAHEPKVQQFAAEIDFELWKKLKKYLIDVNLNHRQFLERIIKDLPEQ